MRGFPRHMQRMWLIMGITPIFVAGLGAFLETASERQSPATTVADAVKDVAYPIHEKALGEV